MSSGSDGQGIGEAPNSRLNKFSTWLVIFLIVLFTWQANATTTL
ncbi:MAG: hypothetical protein OTJ43_02415 [Dehalococcoidia bacterium]|nr:hypothetical protein [Dehalococcoidia bacterium]